MSAIQELAPYISAYQGNIKRAKEDQHYTIDRLVEESGVSRSAVTKLCAGTQQDPKLYNSAALCRVLGLSLDDLFGLAQPAESPEELTEQIHHVELKNAKLEATTAAQSAQIRSTHTMCYVLALFCMLLSFSLIACLVTDAQSRNISDYFLCNPKRTWRKTWSASSVKKKSQTARRSAAGVGNSSKLRSERL